MKTKTTKERVAKIVEWRLEQLSTARIGTRIILESLAVDAYNLGKRDQRRAKR